MKKILLLGLFVILLGDIFAYTSLRIGDPRKSWSTYQGNIDYASLTVEPKGTYIEYGLYLTFSSKGSPWTYSKDTLEVVLNFDLPSDAIIHDSWLWLGDDTLKAHIIDKWTASSIYEGIVNRRQDPSILTKKSINSYELRVFPMPGNSVRKVKISYMLPAQWNTTSINAGLPFEILKASRYVPANFDIYLKNDSNWSEPKLSGVQSIGYLDKIYPGIGQCKYTILTSSNYSSNINVEYPNPISDGYYFSKYQYGDEGIYQLVLMPNQFLSTLDSKKVAVLVDYDASNSNIKQSELLQILKEQMLANFNENDSFNLFFSNLSIKKYSNNWVQATADNINEAFSSIQNPLSTYSNLPSLLYSGIDFIKNNGNDGEIVLITDSGNYGSYQVANTLIADILELMSSKIDIHIADYQSLNYSYNYINNHYYAGNEYLYTNLSKLTAGSYNNINNGFNLSSLIDEAFLHLGGSINSFDLHTDLDYGFCHSRFNIGGNDNLIYLNQPIMQVGKFKGEFPFEIEISGLFNDKLFSKNIAISGESTIESDSLLQQIWAGLYIKSLESQYQSNEIINEIIQNSIDSRILSFYTAFLCVEDSLDLNANNDDDDILIGTDDPEGISLESVTAYPNPFIDNISIDINCGNISDILEIGIYDINGILVHKFDHTLLSSGENTLYWNCSEISNGFYILVYKTKTGLKTIKMLKKS